MNNLDKIVFVITDGQIFRSAIRDLDGYIETTTTPRGNGPTFHVRGTDLWTWGRNGNAPRRVSSHETEAEAIEALEETFYDDFMNSTEISWFYTRDAAEQFLSTAESGL